MYDVPGVILVLASLILVLAGILLGMFVARLVHSNSIKQLETNKDEVGRLSAELEALRSSERDQDKKNQETAEQLAHELMSLREGIVSSAIAYRKAAKLVEAQLPLPDSLRGQTALEAHSLVSGLDSETAADEKELSGTDAEHERGENGRESEPEQTDDTKVSASASSSSSDFVSDEEQSVGLESCAPELPDEPFEDEDKQKDKL